MARPYTLCLAAMCLAGLIAGSEAAQAAEPSAGAPAAAPPAASTPAAPAEAGKPWPEKPSTEAAPLPPPETPLLMEAWDAVGLKKPMDSIGLQTYGWIESGFMGRLTGGYRPLPLRLFDGLRPNNLLLNQMKLTIERPIDSTKAFDLGGRADFLYGSDAKFMHSLGLTDTVCGPNEINDCDLQQLYFQGFAGKGNDQGEGLDILFGKFSSPIGYEATDAPSAPLYSRGLLFNSGPYAHTGVKANYTFGPEASAYVAVVRGWDVFNDDNDASSYIVGGALSTKEQVGDAPRASLLLNVITGPEQADNSRDYRTLVDVTGAYRWNERLSQALNFNYGTEQHGADPGPSHWSGVAHYLQYAFTDNLRGTWRAEWFQDTDGVVTGIQGNLYEMTWGVSITPLPKHPILRNLIVRPEIRWDWTDEEGVFAGRNSQLTAGFDVIFKF